VPASPSGLVSSPAHAHAHFTLPSCQTQLHSRTLPPTSASTFHCSHTLLSARNLRPADDHPKLNVTLSKPLHNGSAQLIHPARAVLCAYAGPLIEHQRTSTQEQFSSRPSLTVSDDSSYFHIDSLFYNAGLIREELRASATFPPVRKVLTCASTSPTTGRPSVCFLAWRRRIVITGLQSCESSILQVHCLHT